MSNLCQTFETVPATYCLINDSCYPSFPGVFIDRRVWIWKSSVYRLGYCKAIHTEIRTKDDNKKVWASWNPIQIILSQKKKCDRYGSVIESTSVDHSGMAGSRGSKMPEWTLQEWLDPGAQKCQGGPFRNGWIQGLKQCHLHSLTLPSPSLVLIELSHGPNPGLKGKQMGSALPNLAHKVEGGCFSKGRAGDTHAAQVRH